MVGCVDKIHTLMCGLDFLVMYKLRSLWVRRETMVAHWLRSDIWWGPDAWDGRRENTVNFRVGLHTLVCCVDYLVMYKLRSVWVRRVMWDDGCALTTEQHSVRSRCLGQKKGEYSGLHVDWTFNLLPQVQMYGHYMVKNRLKANFCGKEHVFLLFTSDFDLWKRILLFLF